MVSVVPNDQDLAGSALAMLLEERDADASATGRTPELPALAATRDLLQRYGRLRATLRQPCRC